MAAGIDHLPEAPQTSKYLRDMYLNSVLARYAVDKDFDLRDPATAPLINFSAAFRLWWAAKERIIWRVSGETADYLSGVRINFIPPAPPESWHGDAIVAESSDGKTMFGDVVALVAYRYPTMDGDLRYFVACTTADGAAFTFSVRPEAGKIPATPDGDWARINCGIGGSDAIEGPEAGRFMELIAPCIRFIFALSYYVLNPDRTDIRTTNGPVKRNKKGKPVRKKGKPIPLWNYQDLRIRQASPDTATERGPLDKEGLSLSPVVVAPHIRRRGDKIIIVDAYESHRWRRKVRIGKKIKI